MYARVRWGVKIRPFLPQCFTPVMHCQWQGLSTTVSGLVDRLWRLIAQRTFLGGRYTGDILATVNNVRPPPPTTPCFSRKTVKWKNYRNRSIFAKIIAKVKVARYLWPTVYRRGCNKQSTGGSDFNRSSSMTSMMSSNHVLSFSTVDAISRHVELVHSQLGSIGLKFNQTHKSQFFIKRTNNTGFKCYISLKFHAIFSNWQLTNF